MNGVFISVISVAFTIVSTAIGFTYKFIRDIMNDLKELETNLDTKVSRVYERFDEHKREIESKFVRKDICSIAHDSTREGLEKLEAKVDELSVRIDTKLDLIMQRLAK